MSWLQIITPLIFVFIAYLWGKSAGRKEVELKYAKKEQMQNQSTDEIIANNNNLTDDELNSWVQNNSKK